MFHVKHKLLIKSTSAAEEIAALPIVSVRTSAVAAKSGLSLNDKAEKPGRAYQNACGGGASDGHGAASPAASPGGPCAGGAPPTRGEDYVTVFAKIGENLQGGRPSKDYLCGHKKRGPPKDPPPCAQAIRNAPERHGAPWKANKREIPGIAFLLIDSPNLGNQSRLLKRLYQKTVFELYNHCFIPQLLH